MLYWFLFISTITTSGVQNTEYVFRDSRSCYMQGFKVLENAKKKSEDTVVACKSFVVS